MSYNMVRSLSSIPSLPIEVIEVIIDHCAQPPTVLSANAEDLLEDPRVTLRACALTCRAWLARSRYNLFRHIELGDGVPLKSLINTLRTNHHCASNVRVMEIFHPSALSALLLLIDRLPNLAWIHLYCNEARRDNFFFMSMTQFSSILLLTISFPSDWQVVHILRLLSSFPNLIYLNCGPDFCQSLVEPYPLHRYCPSFHLQCVVFNSVPSRRRSDSDSTSDDTPGLYLYSVLPHLYPSMFSSLRTCLLLIPEIWTEPLREDNWMAKLLLAGGASIANLDLDFWNSPYQRKAHDLNALSALSVHENTALRRLCLRFRQWTSTEVRVTCKILLSVNSPFFRHLDICITDLSSSSVGIEAWRQFEDVLNSKRCLSLQRCNFVYNAADYSGRKMLERLILPSKSKGRRIMVICEPFEPPARTWVRVNGY